MELTPALKDFIQAHLNDDTDKLLLSASGFPGIDIPFAVDQIVSRRQIKEKLPNWYSNDALVFPAKITTEQCSSEITALYKQRLVVGGHLCDLTGGLGIDSYYFSQNTPQVTYIERFISYCKAAESNFSTLEAHNIRVINGDSAALAHTLDEVTTFYADPARRSDTNKRVFALQECEPDIVRLKAGLLNRSRRLVVKISPMADIPETLRLLPETKVVHILSVKNECKELLFVLEQADKEEEPEITCINYTTTGREEKFSFRLSEEKNAIPETAGGMKQYLYEPNSSILKGGAFKLTGQLFGIEKLHRHSHLYTSDRQVNDFPGRSFKIEETFVFSGKLLKQLAARFPQANITTRNFNLSVAEIRKRSGIREGGDVYLFATTAEGNKHLVIACRKA